MSLYNANTLFIGKNNNKNINKYEKYNLYIIRKLQCLS